MRKLIMVFRILIAGLIFSTSFSSFLFADEPEDLKSEVQALREEVKALREELKAVKKQAPETVAQKEAVTQEDLQGVRTEVATLRDQWQRTITGDYGADTKVPTTSRSLTLGGIVQTRFTETEDKSAKDGFDLSFLSLSFKGSLRRDYEKGRNLDYLFSLATTSDFTIKPLDAYISYSVLPSLNLEKPYLTLFLGQQKKPFGLDPQATEEKKPTIKSAQFDTNLGLGTRDIGIVARGDLFPFVDYGFRYRVPLLEYSFGIVNGAGPNTSDNNNRRDYVGRLILNAPSEYNSLLRGLSLGGSYWRGTTTLSGNLRDKERIGADLSYVHTPIGITAEYAQGEDEQINRSLTKSQGYAVTLFYNFGQQFVRGFKSQDRYDDWYPLTYQPFVRFDHWDPNKSVSGDQKDIYTFGLNWFFAETTKLQFNYNLKKEESSEVDNNEFLVQFQYGF
jgi:hypothetical protein